ncbi:hypothetical protein MTO96_039566 [Rhipicephalus appendiculatus]
MFGMFFVVQFTQTSITASRNVPSHSPQLRRLAELVSRLDEGSIAPCMHYVVAGAISQFGGNASHLVSLRAAVRKCGKTCLTYSIEGDCIPRAMNGTHAIVVRCLGFNENNGISKGIVLGDETLLTYVSWLPTHARYPER